MYFYEVYLAYASSICFTSLFPHVWTLVKSWAVIFLQLRQILHSLIYRAGYCIYMLLGINFILKPKIYKEGEQNFGTFITLCSTI